ncbi:MAG: HAD-IIB family hydrolase [Caldithrix sp.]|nr:HAD-IIB family hydrolase [Caldithrix sp.]
MDRIVFTDLDGTLLDINSYEASGAGQALEYLESKHIPVIPCTSKTHREVIQLRNILNMKHPFIVENGSAIFLPKKYFPDLSSPSEEKDGYDYVLLGKTYDSILSFLKGIQTTFNMDIQGFHEMSVEEIARHTHLTINEARQAKKRFFSEPYILHQKTDDLNAVAEYCTQNGFRLLRGNRFFHLIGATDKGKAVRHLTDLYLQKTGRETLQTIGIGDSMNDLQMLEAVTVPVLVQKPDGSYQQGIDLSNLYYAKGIGPVGWNEAILSLL